VVHFLLVLLMVTSGHAGNETAKIIDIFTTFGKHLIPGLLVGNLVLHTQRVRFKYSHHSDDSSWPR